MATEAPSPTRSYASRFSIRLPRPLWIGLAAIVVIATGAGLRIGLPIYRQQIAMREIERLGGKILTIPVGPEWLRNRVGSIFPVFFARVVGVDLRDTDADDATLLRVREFPHLYHLRLAHTHVTDTGLANLEGLTELGWLNLMDTAVTDDGLEYLKGKTGLYCLDLTGTNVSDAAVTELKQPLPGLTIHR
jgi:hypothetical protein